MVSMAIEPIRVERAAQAAESVGGGAWWVWAIALAVACVAVSALGAWVWRRSGPAGAPHERAFRALARRFGLTVEHRRIIRSLAGHLDAAPVALVVCRSAYERAVAADERAHAERGDGPPMERRGRCLEIHHRLFG